MNEYMVEQLEKKETTATDILIKASLIVATALSFLLFFVSSVGTIVFIALVFADYFLFKRLDVEYEYSYFDGSLDIAKIMSRESRKELFSTNIKEEMELLAPSDAPELQYHQVEKTLDYSTKKTGNKTYTMVTLYKGQKVKMIFEPNEKMLNIMKDVAPRKVVF